MALTQQDNPCYPASPQQLAPQRATPILVENRAVIRRGEVQRCEVVVDDLLLGRIGFQTELLADAPLNRPSRRLLPISQ